jgi:PAS domain S-box-containing protein
LPNAATFVAGFGLLELPSWLTKRYLLWGLGVAATLVLAALVWAETLQREVRDQTGVLLERLGRITALEERYRELFENAHDVVFACGLHGRLISLNKAGETLSGYSRREVIGRPILDFIAPGQRFAVAETLSDLAKGGGPAVDEWEVETRAGERLRLEVSLRPILLGGKALGIQGIARDLT